MDGDGQEVVLRVVPPPADIAITGFRPGTNNFAYDDDKPLIVDYTIDILVPEVTEIAPFEIGIFTSRDGISPHDFLYAYSVDQQSDLTEGSHTVVIDPSFSDIPEDYYLMAVVDSGFAVPETNEDNNFGLFDGGVFFDAASGIVHVHEGTNVTIAQDTIPDENEDPLLIVTVTVDNDTYQFRESEVNEVHVRTHGCNDTVNPKIDDQDPDKNNQKPVLAFGGDGNDTLRSGFAVAA